MTTTSLSLVLFTSPVYLRRQDGRKAQDGLGPDNQEKLEVMLEPQKDTVADGDVVWPLSHHTESPQRRLLPPSSPLPLVVTAGSSPLRIWEAVQVHLWVPLIWLLGVIVADWCVEVERAPDWKSSLTLDHPAMWPYPSCYVALIKLLDVPPSQFPYFTSGQLH